MAVRFAVKTVCVSKMLVKPQSNAPWAATGAYFVSKFGGPYGDRTHDTRIKSSACPGPLPSTSVHPDMNVSDEVPPMSSEWCQCPSMWLSKWLSSFIAGPDTEPVEVGLPPLSFPTLARLSRLRMPGREPLCCHRSHHRFLPQRER